MLSNTSVRRAEASGSGVRPQLDGPTRSSLEVDHVIVGTGYHCDMARLTFLPEDRWARATMIGGFPVLTRAGESTVPSTYSAGALAAYGLGASMRFIAGTYNIAAPLTCSVATARKEAEAIRHSPGRAIMRCSRAMTPGFEETTWCVYRMRWPGWACGTASGRETRWNSR